MAAQVWLCSFRSDETKQCWEFEVTASPPMAQANAEVAGIKSLESTRPGETIRCTHSRFVREI